MKRIFFNHILLVALFTSLLFTGSLFTNYSHAELPRQSAAKDTQAKAYTWKTRDNTLTTWLQTDLVADITPQHSRISYKNQNYDNLLVNTPKLRIWRVTDNAYSKIKGKTNSKQHLRPVFSDGPNGGPLRVLMDGVIIVLDPKLSQASAATWLAQRDLKGEPLSIADNAFLVETLVKTKSEQSSLDLANQLTQENDPSLIIAEPNWWTERSRR